MDAPVSNRLTAAYHVGRLLNQLAWQLRQAFFTASVDINVRIDETLSRLIAVSYQLVEDPPNRIEDAALVVRQTWKEELCCEEAADAIAACVEPAPDFDTPSETPGGLIRVWVDPLLKNLQVCILDKLADSERWAFELGQWLDQGVRRPDCSDRMTIKMNVRVNPDDGSGVASLEGPSFQPGDLEADSTWPGKLRELFSKVGMPTTLYDKILRTWEHHEPSDQLSGLPTTIERLDRGIRGHLILQR
jgi:hypothetical protein